MLPGCGCLLGALPPSVVPAGRDEAGVPPDRSSVIHGTVPTPIARL
jgi:hypothetical protein